MKAIVNGALGAMGRNVLRLMDGESREAVALIDRSFPANDCAAHEYREIIACEVPADVLIDFSHHSTTGALLSYCVGRGLPAVIGTTGHTDEEKAVIAKAAESIPVFFAANMSVGVAVVSELVRRASEALPGTEVEIIEIHHDRKVDVPSGTALVLAEAVRSSREDSTLNIGRPDGGKRTKEEIGIHSLRMGNVTGTHEVIFTNGLETITIRHEAHDRALFAEGALRAAEWLATKPAGLYGMSDMLG